jgi:hypothetical protein
MPRILVFLASAVLAGALAGPASAAWTGVTDLAPANALNKPIGPPSIALGRDGTAFAAFQRFDGANLRAAVAMRVPGGGFGAAVDLSPAGKDAADPVVAVDPQGNATLAWLQLSDLTIRARYRPAGGDWTEPTTLSATQAITAPAVAVGVNGAAVVAWGRKTGNGEVARVEAATRAAGDVVFGPAKFASPDAGNDLCRGVHVAMDAAGDVAAIWTRRTTTAGAYRAETAVKAAGATDFQPSESRSTPTGEAGCNTDIRMTPGGRVTAIWDHSDAAGAPFYVAVAERSAPFTTPWSGQTKLSTLTADSTEPVLALDAAGNAGATWLAGGQIVSAFRTGTSPFSTPPKPLSGATNLRGEAVAASPNGDMMAAYVGASNGNDAIFSARRRLGTAFGDVLPVAVTTPGGRLDLPGIALDDQGNAFAVWQRTVGGVSTAQVSAFDPVPPAITAASVPASGFSGVPVSMAAAATDRMSAAGLRFDFGDGSSAAGGGVEHIYGRPGDYTVTVTATDAAGNASSVARPIHVAQGPIIGGNTAPDRLLAAATASWDRLRNGRTRMKTLVVNELAGPEVVKLVCKGNGCRHGVNRTVRKHGKTVSFTKQVKGLTLRPKAALIITVTRPGFGARVISYTMVRKRDPKKTMRCLKPGAKRPGSC